MTRSKSSGKPPGARADTAAERARARTSQKPDAGRAAEQLDAAAAAKAEEERRQRNDRRESDDRRRELRVLVDTGEKRPDRRNGPRRTSE